MQARTSPVLLTAERGRALDFLGLKEAGNSAGGCGLVVGSLTMSFDERTPRDVFDRDAGGRRRPSQIELADDIEARAVAPVTRVVDTTAKTGADGKKKLLLGVVIGVALLAAVVLLVPAKKPAPTTQALPGSGTVSSAPPVVVMPTTTEVKLTSTSDLGFKDTLAAFLKRQRSVKTPAQLAGALGKEFSLPVGIGRAPKASANGALMLRPIGTTQILVEVLDDRSRLVGIQSLTLR